MIFKKIPYPLFCVLRGHIFQEIYRIFQTVFFKHGIFIHGVFQTIKLYKHLTWSQVMSDIFGLPTILVLVVLDWVLWVILLLR